MNKDPSFGCLAVIGVVAAGVIIGGGMVVSNVTVAFGYPTHWTLCSFLILVWMFLVVEVAS